jgi:hypothetical protein
VIDRYRFASRTAVKLRCKSIESVFINRGDHSSRIGQSNSKGSEVIFAMFSFLGNRACLDNDANVIERCGHPELLIIPHRELAMLAQDKYRVASDPAVRLLESELVEQVRKVGPIPT